MAKIEKNLVLFTYYYECHWLLKKLFNFLVFLPYQLESKNYTTHFHKKN